MERITIRAQLKVRGTSSGSGRPSFPYVSGSGSNEACFGWTGTRNPENDNINPVRQSGQGVLTHA